jgi:hypothetical protein
MRGQPGQIFRHINANRKGGGFGQVIMLT